MLQDLHAPALAREPLFPLRQRALPELPARMLARFTLIDYDREMALVAVVRERCRTALTARERTEVVRIVGVSRYVTNPDAHELRVFAGGGG
jgi:acetyltransferase